jgi:hypothetical protein
MAGTSSVALVVPGCTVQLGRPWLLENETCCANARETRPSESSLVIVSGDMMRNKVVGVIWSSYLIEGSTSEREAFTVV